MIVSSLLQPSDKNLEIEAVCNMTECDLVPENRLFGIKDLMNYRLRDFLISHLPNASVSSAHDSLVVLNLPNAETL